jgi:hypothetical protein
LNNAITINYHDENSGYNSLLSRAFSVGIPSWMGFYATTCCCLRPFWWESLRGWDFWLSRSLSSQILFLFTIEFWPLGSLFSRTFSFSRWNSGYKGAFSLELFLFHDGILAIKEPFTRTFLFSRWNSGYQGAFHTNFSFFTMEFWLSRSLSHELFFFHDGILAIKEPFTRTFLFS